LTILKGNFRSIPDRKRKKGFLFPEKQMGVHKISAKLSPHKNREEYAKETKILKLTEEQKRESVISIDSVVLEKNRGKIL